MRAGFAVNVVSVGMTGVVGGKAMAGFTVMSVVVGMAGLDYFAAAS